MAVPRRRRDLRVRSRVPEHAAPVGAIAGERLLGIPRLVRRASTTHAVEGALEIPRLQAAPGVAGGACRGDGELRAEVRGQWSGRDRHATTMARPSRARNPRAAICG